VATLFPIGATTVTYLVTDASTNTATCSFTVTVNDTQNPTIVCPANITQNNDAAVCGATVTYATPVGADNCPGSITTLTAGQASGTLFPTGTTTNTFVVTDASGNTATCSFNVTVNDAEPPTITCNAPITVSNDAGVCGAVVTYTNTSTDNCPGQVITQTAGLASGSVFPIGTTTNTFVVTDASGNTATCSFNVTVNDTELPTITCNAPITVSNDAGVCGAVVTYTNTSTDNCPGQVITQTAGLASGSVFPIGTTTNTFVVTDASGNTATCSFNVTVNDTELPTITCNAPITVSNDAGVCGAVVTYTNTSTDNCPGQVITQTAGLASGSVFPIGTTTNTFVVTDASGNTATCSFNVTVNDTELPTITCNAPITVSNDAGVCGAVVTYTNTSTDNCPGQVITQTAGLASGSVFPIGTTTNTFVVTDASGNTATCSFNVTVNDTELPTITCNAPITVSNDAGVCGAVVTYTNTSTDNCPGQVITQTAGLASGSVFPIGTTTNTFVVTDASGNTATCSFNVTVNDTELPTITCNAPITVSNDAGVCGAVVTYPNTSTDNCPGQVITQTAGLASGSVFPIGTTTNTFVVTDASGNTATCSFNVTVNDTELPTIVCTANITQTADAGVCDAAVIVPAPASGDNCAVATIINSYNGTSSANDTYPVGTTTITWTVTDVNGNINTCIQDVTITDNEIPTIVCSPNITQIADAGVCDAAVIVPAPVTADNCAVASIVNSYNSTANADDTYPVGTTTITWIVTDIHGNINTCTQDVIIVDTQVPTITCPGNIAQFNDLGTCDANVVIGLPVSADNCAVSTVLNDYNGGSNASDIYPVGTTVIIWTVTDIHGNTNTCGHVVTITDNEIPSITCPPNITQTADAGVCDAAVIVPAPATGDNCAIATVINSYNGTSSANDTYPVGTTTITWTVTDIHGNINTCTQDITITDNEIPTIVCSPNITQTADAGVCDAAVIVPAPVTGDNCAVASIVNSYNSTANANDTYPVGTTTITWIVTDIHGNINTCTQDVTITDNEIPTIICAANITQTADAGVCDAAVIVPSPATGDNCAVATVVNNYNGTASANDTYPVGTTTITWTVTDIHGNINTCTQVVTITDNEIPTIVCSPNITQTADAGVCDAAVIVPAPAAGDNCAVATIINSYNGTSSANDTYPVGTTTITWTVTDIHGNINTCTQDITITDNEIPTIVCSPNITQTADAGVCDAAVIVPAPVTGDNCAVASIVNSYNSTANANDTYPVGTTTITWIVTDIHGNINTCTQDVTITDNEIPTIICAANITQTADAGVCDAAVIVPSPATGDNCAVATVVNNYNGTASANDTYPVGTTTITWTVTDIHGNINTCTQVVTITDNEIPTIVCSPNITQTADAGVCDAAVIVPAPAAGDNCAVATIINSYNGTSSANDTYPVGTTTITWTVTDIHGNINTCTQDITITDNEIPTIVCSPNITQTADAGVCDAAVIVPAPVTGDNCAVASIVNSYNSTANANDTYPVGTTTITWIVTDIHGNINTCMQDVTITDNEIPTIICAANITQTADAGVCDAAVIVPSPATGDNCAVATVVNNYNGTASANDTYPVGTTTITWTVTDIHGNINTCTQDITITDDELPIIICPANIVLPNDAGVCGALTTYLTPVGTDNCPGSVTTMIAGLPTNSVFPIGITTVTYIVTDPSSNISACSFDVQVDDIELPTLVCPGNIVQSNDLGVCGATISYLTPVGLDNCPGTFTFMTLGLASGSVFPIGTTTVTYLAFDVSSNFTTCSFVVTINDTENPTFTCPSSVFQSNDAGVCGATINYLTPVGLDNCPGVSTFLTGGLSSGSLFPIGTTNVSYLTTDFAGNFATCNFNVTITDNELPVLACPSDINQTNDPTLCGATVNYLAPVGIDNCPGTVTVQLSGLTSGSFFPVGTSFISYQSFDAYGNTSTCTFQVNVFDTEVPALVCPPDQTVPVDFNCEFTIPDYTLITSVTDNCALSFVTQSIPVGTIITTAIPMTISSGDAVGNISTCVFSILPVDVTNPVVTCPPNQIVYSSGLCDFTVNNYTPLSTSTDNCAILSVLQIPAPGSTATSSVTATITAQDLSGNISTCNFDIIALDTITPVAICPGFPIDVFFDANCEFILPDYTPMVAVNENCGIGSITQTPAIGTAITANQTMTIDVIDLSGNATSCTFEVIPSDTIAPTLGCPTNQIQTLSNNCDAILNDFTPLAITTSNCEAVLVTQSPGAGLVFNSTQTIVIIGTDASGNSSFCFFNVTLIDTINPVITCGPDIITCDNVVFFPTPTATDNCNVSTITQIAGLPSGSFFPDGINIITYVALDDFGNSDTCSFTIVVNEKPVGVATTTDVTCNGYADGTIDLSVSAGAFPYTFVWSNGPLTEDINGLAGGTYNVVISDAKGCTDTVEVTINEPNQISSTATLLPITCYDYNDGSIALSVNGGTTPYTYSWSPSGYVGNYISDLPAGNYDVTITDANGCSVDMSFSMNNPDSISIDGTVSQYPNGWQISCEGCYDGSIEVNVTGGSFPYSYDWTTGSNNQSQYDLPAGTYTVIVTDENGCTNEATYILDQPLAVVMSDAFSPNGDGLNDYFQIKNIDRYPNNTLTVMNRWGDVVYKAAPYQNDWYGQSNAGLVLYGADVPEGSYYFILDLNDGSAPIKGYIVINR
jgi:gliding motility-associated-like protein